MLFVKAILIALNTLSLIGALYALIRYVIKTAEIAKLSEDSIEDLKQISLISRKAVDLSRDVLSEMKATRTLLTAPLVIAYFERRDGENISNIFFVIENIGNGVAKNISYTFNPELTGHYEDEEDIQRISNLGKYIDSLPPKYQMVNLLGRVGHYIDLESEDNEELNSDLPRKFELDLTFQDAITDEIFNDNFLLDLRIPLGRCKQ